MAGDDKNKEGANEKYEKTLKFNYKLDIPIFSRKFNLSRNL